MLKIETIENFAGFGDRNAPGEIYHSENMIPGQFGLEANLAVVDQTANDSPTLFNWFAEKFPNTNDGIYAFDAAGKLFYYSGGAWNSIKSLTSATGNGLIGVAAKLYYAYDTYLGLYTGSSFFDTYKDLSTNSSDKAFLKPLEVYEDWIVIGNGRNISLFNMRDDSIANQALTLPGDFVVRAIKSNQTGLLIGANFKGRSIIFLWDAQATRSISEWIWFESPIQSICKYGSRWIVTTAKMQYITDGYSLSTLPLPPDAIVQADVFNCLPAGTRVIGDKLYTANTVSSYNRLKSGLYIQDLINGTFSFISPGNKADMTMGAVYEDSSSVQHLSYSTNLPSAYHVSTVINQAPSSVTLISPRLGNGANKKVAAGAKLDLSVTPNVTTLSKSGSFSVSLKVYNFKRQLWGYGVTNGASSAADTLKVDGTVSGKNNGKVGDEVTILSGANAGKVRHIASISGEDTSSEVWTLDSALSNNTESGAYFNVQPFQLVKTKSITISSLSELESIYFDIRNRIKGRKFLLKAVITDISGVSVSIPSLAFIYDDLGVI